MIKPNTFLNNLWLKSCGQKEDWSWLEPKQRFPNYARLLETEWDEDFWQSLARYRPLHDLDEFKSYAKNRMIMGAMRYGTLASENWRGYDHENNYEARIKLGLTTLNLECFVDAYNIAYLHYLNSNTNSAKRLACEAIMLYKLFEHDYEWSFNVEDDGVHCERMS